MFYRHQELNSTILKHIIVYRTMGISHYKTIHQSSLNWEHVNDQLRDCVGAVLCNITEKINSFSPVIIQKIRFFYSQLES